MEIKESLYLAVDKGTNLFLGHSMSVCNANQEGLGLRTHALPGRPSMLWLLSLRLLWETVGERQFVEGYLSGMQTLQTGSVPVQALAIGEDRGLFEQYN